MIVGFWGFIHRLELELEIDGEVHRFDSHQFLNSKTALDPIDIVVTINDFFCFDTVLSIHAAPSE